MNTQLIFDHFNLIWNEIYGRHINSFKTISVLLLIKNVLYFVFYNTADFKIYKQFVFLKKKVIKQIAEKSY